jgi:hypothetical protein
MRDALPPGPHGLARNGFTCQCCGQVVITSVEGLFHRPPAGSAQRFCSPACRQAAYRRRQAGAREDTPRQHTGGRNRALTPDQQTEQASQRVSFQMPEVGQFWDAVDTGPVDRVWDAPFAARAAGLPRAVCRA